MAIQRVKNHGSKLRPSRVTRECIAAERTGRPGTLPRTLIIGTPADTAATLALKEHLVIDHVSLGTTRYAAAVAFYQQVLAPLGLGLKRDTGAEASFGNDEHWGFFLYPAPDDVPVTGRGTHLAFKASSRAQVQAVHAAALAAAGQDIFTPRERPDISASYFGAMFLDLDGHRVEVVTHHSQRDSAERAA